MGRFFVDTVYMYDVVVKKFAFAISSPDEFLLRYASGQRYEQTNKHTDTLISILRSPTGGKVIIIGV